MRSGKEISQQWKTTDEEGYKVEEGGETKNKVKDNSQDVE